MCVNVMEIRLSTIIIKFLFLVEFEPSDLKKKNVYQKKQTVYISLYQFLSETMFFIYI